jgi:hypothetical protein
LYGAIFAYYSTILLLSSKTQPNMNPLYAFLFLAFLGLSYDSPDTAFRKDGKSIMERIKPPKGYAWVTEEKGSFGAYLQTMRLKPAGAKILDFNKKPIKNQFEHIAVLDIDVGTKNLQQCADAIIRLRAEYLWAQKRFDEIKFNFTSGEAFSWRDFKNGVRPKVSNKNKVTFVKSAPKSDGYEAFKRYLEIIFIYAGTISLNEETNRVTDNGKIKTGDMIISPGSPGHAAIIMGRAKNKQGHTVFLLAQGYTPAQSIHIITNPFRPKINPWYEVRISQSPLITARYAFKTANVKSF